MANLSDDLQESISDLGTETTALIQAVRNYKSGSISAATNDLIDASNAVLSTIESKETTLLGLINYSNGAKIVPSLIMDFSNQVFLKGAGVANKAFDPTDYMSIASYAGQGLVMGPNGRFVASDGEGGIRYTRDPTTGEMVGIWIEGHSTNLITDPDLSGSYWGKENVTVAATTAVQPPIEGQTVYKVTSTSDNVFRSVRLVAPPTGATLNVVSFFVRAGTASRLKTQMGTTNIGSQTLDYDLADPTNYTKTSGIDWAHIEFIGNSWYRVSIAITDSLYGQTKLAWLQSEEASDSYFYMCCPQFEERFFSTSYIVGNEGVNTRNSDYIELPTGDWFNSRQGTMVYDFYPRGGHGNMWIFDSVLIDRSNDYDPYSLRSAGSDTFWYGRIVGNIATEDGDSPLDKVAANGRVRICMSIDASTGESVVYINGYEADRYTGTIGNQQMDVEYFLLGRWGGGSQFSFMYLRELTYYPFVLTAEQGKEVSSQ